MENPNIEVELRKTICWALAVTEKARSLPSLFTALRDPAESLRWTAALELGKINDQSAVSPLIETLQTDSSPTVRGIAANSLGSLGNSLATPALIKIMLDPTETPELRGHAAEALSGIRGEEVIAPLIAALEDEVVDVRFWATFALGQIGDPRALPALGFLIATDSSVLPGWGAISQEAAEAVAGIKWYMQTVQDEDEDEADCD